MGICRERTQSCNGARKRVPVSSGISQSSYRVSRWIRSGFQGGAAGALSSGGVSPKALAVCFDSLSHLNSSRQRAVYTLDVERGYFYTFITSLRYYMRTAIPRKYFFIASFWMP